MRTLNENQRLELNEHERIELKQHKRIENLLQYLCHRHQSSELKQTLFYLFKEFAHYFLVNKRRDNSVIIDEMRDICGRILIDVRESLTGDLE